MDIEAGNEDRHLLLRDVSPFPYSERTGRTVAATGLIRGDGAVTSIGGLASKARAAVRVGADVLVYPATQRCRQAAIMEKLGPTSMTVIPVASLSEAIEDLDGSGRDTGPYEACA